MSLDRPHYTLSPVLYGGAKGTERGINSVGKEGLPSNLENNGRKQLFLIFVLVCHVVPQMPYWLFFITGDKGTDCRSRCSFFIFDPPGVSDQSNPGQCNGLDGRN